MQNKKSKLRKSPRLFYKHVNTLGRADEEDIYLKTEKSNEDIADDDEDDDGDYGDLPDRNCPDDVFECVADHKCVALEKRCDNHTDCSDGSDEHECANDYSPFSEIPNVLPAPTGEPDADSKATTTGTKIGDGLQLNT